MTDDELDAIAQRAAQPAREFAFDAYAGGRDDVARLIVEVRRLRADAIADARVAASRLREAEQEHERLRDELLMARRALDEQEALLRAARLSDTRTADPP